MTAADLERLRAELKATIERSTEKIRRVDELLAEKNLPAPDETTDGLFQSRARPRPKLPPSE
jgi:microcompartment protein CcmL/EutN